MLLPSLASSICSVMSSHTLTAVGSWIRMGLVYVIDPPGS